MEQVLVNTPATLRETWYEDGVAVDPGTVTVTVTRADGTVLATAAPTSGTGAAARTYNLSAANTALLDLLTLTWVSLTHGTLTSYAAIPGAFYFSIAEALAFTELAGKTAAEIAAGRTLAEQAFEHATGYAFVPRYARQRLSAMRGTVLHLPKRPLRVIRAIDETLVIGGTPVTLATSGYTATEDGIYRPSGWTPGPKNVTVGYEYGADEPPERVKRAVLTLAKNWLVDGPIDDRATAIPAGEAGGVITLATPGVRGATFGIPEVDAVVQEYSVKSGIHSLPLTRAENTYYESARPGW